MIVNTNKSTVETVGDIKEFKTSIDPKNLEFITMLLSSNLYSNPQRSFIREIISNAWDSHVEANNTKNPVIVRVNNESISIRDYGVGLSPERFETIFCNIGSSTKRDSNDYIGAYGIGHFSPLSCSNIVHFVSYYNGIRYHYIMVKDGSNITTNLVETVNTKEANGLEVILINIDFHDYIEAFDYTVFFPNLYIDSNISRFTAFNDVKIKRYNNYSCASIIVNHKILLGNVLYPCEEKYLSEEVLKFYNWILKSGIVINFNIGELQVTPNRESIIYNKETIDLINKRFIEAKNELESIYTPILSTSFDNIFEYEKYINGNLEYDPIENKIIGNNDYYINKTYNIIIKPNKQSFKIKYKDKDFTTDDISLISSFKSRPLPSLKALVIPKNYTTNKYEDVKIWSYSCDKINSIYSKYDIIQLKDSTKVSYKLKEYLRETFAGPIILYWDINVLRESVKNYRSLNSTYKLTDNEEYICQEVYNYIKSKTKEIDFKTDEDFLKWKEKNKNITSPVLDSIILHVDSPSYNYDKGYIEKCNNIEEVKRKCLFFNKGIVFDKYGKEDYVLRYIAKYFGYKYIAVKSSLYDIIMAQNWSFVVSHDYILNQLSCYNIIYTVYKTLNMSEFNSKIIDMMPINKKGIIYNINKTLHNCNSPEIVRRAKEIGVIDVNIQKECLYYKRFYDAYMKAIDLNYGEGLAYNNTANALIYKAMIKQGIRISYKCYSKVKNNALINFIYGKEDN